MRVLVWMQSDVSDYIFNKNKNIRFSSHMAFYLKDEHLGYLGYRLSLKLKLRNLYFVELF